MAARTPPPAWAVRTEADRRALADGCYWDQAAADRVIRFAERFIAPKYTSGAFQLFEWQRRLLMSLYGWRKADGTRRFRWAVLHVPKKNGKTLLVSIIAAYELFGAGEPDALVVSASTAAENAKQVYEQLVTTIGRRPQLAKIAKPVEFKKTIRVPSKGAEFRSLSAEGRSHEGYNCSCVIVDEAHAHRSQALFNCLRYSTAGRPNGIVVVISTAGDDLTHFYYGFVEKARRVLAGTDTDPTLYAEVYEADPDKDDLDDPAVWKRCNPSLDLYDGFTSEQFGYDIRSARLNTGEWLNFQRYRLNIFRRAEDEPYIDLARWDQLAAEVPEEVLKALPCFLGFDGSATIDPTSLSATWLFPERKYHVRSWAWVAEQGVRERERSNLPKYTQFAAEGCMTITPGNLIYKDAVRRHILGLRAAGHQVKALAMDTNGAHIFGTELQAEGFIVHTFPQSYRYFNEPTREFQTAVAANAVSHDGNGWLRYCLHSVRIDSDQQNNVRPVKAKSADHIDGAVSALMSFRLAMEAAAAPPPPPSSYLERGIELWD